VHHQSGLPLECGLTFGDAAPAPYVPTLRPANIERIRQWHEPAYASLATRGERTSVTSA